MFITTRNHLATIKEIRTYWSNELDRMLRENVRLKTQLEAKTRSETAPEPPLPAPLPAANGPRLVIIHLQSNRPLWTLCGYSAVDISLFGYSRNLTVAHRFALTRDYKTTGNESWCADCLG